MGTGNIELLNTPLEAAIHVACCLVAAWPRGLDIDRLTLVHQRVLFSDPRFDLIREAETQQATGLAVRRENVRAGLDILERAELVEVGPDNVFIGRDRAWVMCDLLESEDCVAVKNLCAEFTSWVVNLNDSELADAYSAIVMEDYVRQFG